MIYGDGAFKDPVGKIWELADPVVAPAYTAGLEGHAQRSQAEVPGGQRLCRSGGPGAEGCHLRLHPAQGCRSHRQNGLSGHHTPPSHRPGGLAVRSDFRQRRQGYSHRSGAGLFRQLHKINRAEAPKKQSQVWLCFLFPNIDGGGALLYYNKIKNNLMTKEGQK